MRVDISRKIVTVNSNELTEAISKFECLTNQKAYLFMNKKTIDALSLESPLPFSKPSMFEGCIICNIKGRKVYQNDDLEFGEVEIR